MKNSRIAMAGLYIAVLASVLATDATTALAQRIRPTVERRLHPGSSFWANERASRNIRHATDYARDLYVYSRDAAAIEPDIAKSESEQLGKNIEAATKELENVNSAAGDDKDTLADLDAMGKHLSNAAATHTALHAECCKDSVDGGTCAKCCSEITKELEMASAEHAALMRKLEMKSQSGEKQSK